MTSTPPEPSRQGPLLVHIGFAKCASTTLQSAFFVSRYGFHRVLPRAEVLRKIVMPHPFDFDAESTRRMFVRQLERVPAGRTPFVSQERLAGNPLSGGYDAVEIARRLRATVGEARILIVVREQRAMLESAYKHYVREGGPLPFEAFVRPRTTAKLPKFDASFLEYDKLVREYTERFGAERVLVLPVELLASDADGFVRTIANFAQEPRASNADLVAVRKNETQRVASVPLRRVANGLIHRSEISPGAVMALPSSDRAYDMLASLVPRHLADRAHDSLRRKATEFCEGRYGDSNRRLDGSVPVDLSSLGYDMSGWHARVVASGH